MVYFCLKKYRLVPHIIQLLQSRLAEALPGRKAHELMLGRVKNMPAELPDNVRQSAVLCLLFLFNGELHVLLMKRREDHTAHSGQVSFPGGRFEPEDDGYLHTALREAQEEVGLLPDKLTVLGALSPLYIPVSNFNVNPYVAFADYRPEYKLSHAEVSYVLELPVRELFHPNRKIMTDVLSPAHPGSTFRVNAYKINDTIIWGATAMILSELEWLMREAGEKS